MLDSIKTAQTLLATGRLGLAEHLRLRAQRPPGSVLIVPLQPTAGPAYARLSVEVGLSLCGRPPLSRARSTTAKAPGGSAEVACCGQKREPIQKKGVGVQWQEQKVEGRQQQSVGEDEKQEQEQEQEQEAGESATAYKGPLVPIPAVAAPRSVPALPSFTPAAALSSAVPPTPARVQALRQWQQWQREHQQQRDNSTAPTRYGGKAPDTVVRRTQLARMRSLLNELEGLLESLSEVRARGSARRPELRSSGQGAASIASSTNSSSRPPLRRASKKRISS